MEPLIYIVEDDEGISEVYEGAFEADYKTEFFENGASFFEASYYPCWNDNRA
ncbi:MAG: hypothetical protein IKC16_04735 [Clostridia bacterium]|nr:hypothetical protein [Clostridia bacterium]